jgi:hypothetical protein
VSRVLLVLLTFTVTAQTRLTPAEERGRQIYEKGTSLSGAAIEASIAGDARVPASVVPCINCHGAEGAGRPEGGIVPSIITWTELTKPYAAGQTGGRTHPPYSERLFTRAITMGTDAGGNTLDGAMPRFHLSLADAADLVAYVKRLGDSVDPGVTAETVRLGVLTPSRDSARGGRPMNDLLSYFARVNAGGGIFGRRVELSFAELPTDPAKRAGAVREFLRSEQVFAVIGDFTGGEAELAATLRDTATPAIAAVAPFPATGSPLNRYVFYLDGGLRDELQALVDFAAKRFARTAVVAEETAASAEAAKWLQTADKRIAGGAPDAVYWLRSDMQGADRYPVLLVPGSFWNGATVPPHTQVFVAPQSRDRVLASGAIAAEALRLAGRDLSRAGFIAALESFRDVQTNLARPISYGPSRRVGMDGAPVLMLDSQTREFTPLPGSTPAK